MKLSFNRIILLWMSKIHLSSSNIDLNAWYVNGRLDITGKKSHPNTSIELMKWSRSTSIVLAIYETLMHQSRNMIFSETDLLKQIQEKIPVSRDDQDIVYWIGLDVVGYLLFSLSFLHPRKHGPSKQECAKMYSICVIMSWMELFSENRSRPGKSENEVRWS